MSRILESVLLYVRKKSYFNFISLFCIGKNITEMSEDNYSDSRINLAERHNRIVLFTAGSPLVVNQRDPQSRKRAIKAKILEVLKRGHQRQMTLKGREAKFFSAPGTKNILIRKIFPSSVFHTTAVG